MAAPELPSCGSHLTLVPDHSKYSDRKTVNAANERLRPAVRASRVSGRGMTARCERCRSARERLEAAQW